MRMVATTKVVVDLCNSSNLNKYFKENDAAAVPVDLEK